MSPAQRSFTSFIFSAAFFLLFPPPAGADLSSILQGRTIIVDSGHGTIDYHGKIINPGKHWKDMWEHELNMKIGQAVGEMLQKEGARIIYTRTPSDYWRESMNTVEDNEARAFLANEVKADVFLAVHCDWDPRRRISGITTLYETKESRRLGELVHRSLIRSLKTRDRQLVRDSFTVLDKAEMPAILVETGFLSNRSESKKLASAAYQQKIAKAITDGLKTYFSETSKNPTTPAP